MGFSLVGNSGDQTTNQTTNNYTASLNPQLDLEGSGAGTSAISVSPLFQGSSGNSLSETIGDYYAPINVVSTGDVLGDSALAALNNIQQTQTGASEAAGTTAATSSLSSLLSGNTIYWVLGAITLLFLAHKK